MAKINFVEGEAGKKPQGRYVIVGYANNRKTKAGDRIVVEFDKKSTFMGEDGKWQSTPSDSFSFKPGDTLWLKLRDKGEDNKGSDYQVSTNED